MSSALLSATAHAALDFALPRVCVSCERLMRSVEKGVVCGICWSRVAALPQPVCERCGHPRPAAACRWCELLPPYVRAARSVCWMPGEPAAGIVHALKYGGWHSVAAEMGLRMSRLAFPADVVAERAALVPVPLSAGRLKERGYNQSEVLAAAISRAWRIPVWEDCLARTRSTGTQTELSPEERRANVAGSVRFHTRRKDLRGSHLIVVDDVVTTAATLNECARSLYEAGARIISYVTFGRARSAGDRI